MTLALIGLGVQGLDGIPQGAANYLKACSRIYADVYTSPWPPGLLENLSKLFDGETLKATRVTLEDGRRVLDDALKSNIAVVCIGDPLVATTHVSLRLRAIDLGITFHVYYASSIVNAVFGETGLHLYKLGRVITLVRSTPASLSSIYTSIKDVLSLGQHTLLLLEYSYDENFFLPPPDGLRMLKELEASYKLGIFTDDRLIIVASRVGWDSQSFKAGRLDDMLSNDFGSPPHCIIVPGQLHFTEEEALAKQLKFDTSTLKSCVTTLVSPSKTIVDRTVSKARAALKVAKDLALKSSIKNLDDVFENVEAYLSDAERFLAEGKNELALVEAGYAEGLLDSLRLQGILDMTW